VNTTISHSPAGAVATTLNAWAAHDWNHGVMVGTLAPHDRLIVRTRNSTYEIIVIDPQKAAVMVRGGAFFAEFTPAHVVGSSLGGGPLKMRGVYAGFQLELSTGALPVITTRVRTVVVVPSKNDAIM
jgi:hypothetical protein